ncbi:MAG: hypothetical protein INR65_03240 [Gluconacetobacter diazotrophicus]|nr:hypothetical protein [Gluconacetobacter diazotrophicus]
MTDADGGNGRGLDTGRTNPRHTLVLIVRLWREPADAGATRLRGTVRAPDGASLDAFASLADLSAIIARHLRSTANEEQADG